MVNPNWILATPLLMAAFAGCLGFGGGADVDADADTDNKSGTLGATGSFGNASARFGANASANQAGYQSQWSYENRSGSVSGNNLVVQQPEPKLESFTVANGTETLALNVTADGDGLSVKLRPPGCDAADCEVDVGEAGGGASSPASYDAVKPMEGDWTAVLRLEGDPGPLASEYELQIGTETLKKAAGGSSSSTTTTG